AVDAVAARLGADVDHGVALALRLAEEEALAARDADRERVDQDVAVVARVELHLAADGRDADRVAVATDARDDAAQEPRRLRVIGTTEAERVERRDRPGAHREHVA